MRVACCQLDIVWEDKAANFAKVRALLERAKLPPKTLAVPPEMFATGFSMNVSAIQEGSPSATEQFLSTTARDLGLYLFAGIVKPGRNGKGRNEVVVFDPSGRLVTRYGKMHPFSLGGESQHYEAGGELVSFSCEGFTVAPFICYDLRFPEVFRAAAKRGAQLFIVIASWPNKRTHHWTNLLQARAIENQAYVVGVNRAGKDPMFAYPGRSLIVDPHGEVLADAGEPEGVVGAELDPARVTSWRKDFPALQDMRPDYVN